MQPRWVFSRHRPDERARNSQVEQFFRSDEVANPTTALVREGIENSIGNSAIMRISKVGG